MVGTQSVFSSASWATEFSPGSFSGAVAGVPCSGCGLRARGSAARPRGLDAGEADQLPPGAGPGSVTSGTGLCRRPSPRHRAWAPRPGALGELWLGSPAAALLHVRALRPSALRRSEIRRRFWSAAAALPCFPAAGSALARREGGRCAAARVRTPPGLGKEQCAQRFEHLRSNVYPA